MRIHLFRFLFFVCLLVAVALAWLNRDQLTTDAIKAWVEHGGVWEPDLVRKGLLALALLAVVALLPSLIRRWRRPGKISPQQLQTLLSQDESPLVLDVRNPDEFVGERGHINEAVLSPLPELDNKLEELKAHRTRLIVTV